MSDVLDRKGNISNARKVKQHRYGTRESIKTTIRDERLLWDSDDDVIIVDPPPVDRRISEEIDFIELSRWTDTDPARIRRAAEMAVVQWQQSLAEFSFVSDATEQHLAVRAAKPHEVENRGDYYVSRAYRGLWSVVLVLGLAWGFVSGVAIATGSLLSPSAVLMGIFAVIVLAATLFVAGSRDRIRRRKR